ncbi:MAG: molybdopterin-guanine dinucleotide biosynthesis protein B [Parasporobacterium sp.]|nr:molybdopterin-guanine dinucleotide biosynthesis protein B [Parasporobacterium sp.]
MADIPVIAFSGWSGSGKTTIIEKLIPELKSRGIRTAVIKHDAHDFEIDHEGKDSYRFAHAGADITIISSKEKTALIEQRSLNLNETIAMVHDVELIILEGYNNEPVPRIGISRQDTGKGLRHPAESHIALITDGFSQGYYAVNGQPVYNSFNGQLIPVFSQDSVIELADFIFAFIRGK